MQAVTAHAPGGHSLRWKQPETIQQTAEIVTAGSAGKPVRVDHELDAEGGRIRAFQVGAFRAPKG
jgi:hypothetical protein